MKHYDLINLYIIGLIWYNVRWLYMACNVFPLQWEEGPSMVLLVAAVNAATAESDYRLVYGALAFAAFLIFFVIAAILYRMTKDEWRSANGVKVLSGLAALFLGFAVIAICIGALIARAIIENPGFVNP